MTPDSPALRQANDDEQFVRRPDGSLNDIVLADFGSCIVHAEPDSRYTGIVGTPGCASPFVSQTCDRLS